MSMHREIIHAMIQDKNNVHTYKLPTVRYRYMELSITVV